MSWYQDAVKELWSKYEKPEVERVTVGFSGIDPQKRYVGIDDHETLRSLQGGNEEEHYHLTLAEVEWIREQMLKPEILTEDEIVIIADEEMDDFKVEVKNSEIGEW